MNTQLSMEEKKNKPKTPPPSISPTSIKLSVHCIFGVMQDYIAVVNAFIAHAVLLLMVVLK